MFNHSATKAFIATLFAAVFAMGCEDSGGAEEGGRPGARCTEAEASSKGGS